jgi:hypothetical protein
MGWKSIPIFMNSIVLTLCRSAKPVGYWTVQRGRRFGHVASIGLPITNLFSPITLRRASPALGGPLTFHILPSALTAHHQSPITKHQSLLTAALAAFVRLVLGLISFPLQDEPWPKIRA